MIDLSDEKVLEVLRIFPAQEMYYGGAEILFDFQLYRNTNMDAEEMVRRGATPDRFFNL